MNPELELDVEEKETPEDFEAPELTELPYDRNANQKIPLIVTRGSSYFETAIELSPLSDKNYFALMEEIPAHAKSVKTISTELFAPLAETAKRLAVKRFGYKEREDWREHTHPHDYVSAMQSYLQVSVNENVPKSTGLLDDDEDITVLLDSAFSGVEVSTSISFKGWETQAQRDEYLAASEGKPSKVALASHSHKRLSKEQRFYNLYKELTTGNENYIGEVPAWHAVAAIDGYFSMQIARMGKSLPR